MTITPQDVSSEYDLVSKTTTDVPSPTDPAYTTVTWTKNATPALFNASLAKITTYNVEISGVEVDLTPGGGGLFDQIAYTDPTSTANRNLANVSIYAQTVVIGGTRRHPANTNRDF